MSCQEQDHVVGLHCTHLDRAETTPIILTFLKAAIYLRVRLASPSDNRCLREDCCGLITPAWS